MTCVVEASPHSSPCPLGSCVPASSPGEAVQLPVAAGAVGGRGEAAHRAPAPGNPRHSRHRSSGGVQPGNAALNTRWLMSLSIRALMSRLKTCQPPVPSTCICCCFVPQGLNPTNLAACENAATNESRKQECREQNGLFYLPVSEGFIAHSTPDGSGSPPLNSSLLCSAPLQMEVDDQVCYVNVKSCGSGRAVDAST